MTDTNIDLRNKLLILICTNKKCTMVDIPYIAKRFDMSGKEIMNEREDLPGACRECGGEFKEDYIPINIVKGI